MNFTPLNELLFWYIHLPFFNSPNANEQGERLPLDASLPLSAAQPPTEADGSSDVWKNKEMRKALCTICNKLYAYCWGDNQLERAIIKLSWYTIQQETTNRRFAKVTDAINSFTTVLQCQS